MVKLIFTICYLLKDINEDDKQSQGNKFLKSKFEFDS